MITKMNATCIQWNPQTFRGNENRFEKSGRLVNEGGE